MGSHKLEKRVICRCILANLSLTNSIVPDTLRKGHTRIGENGEDINTQAGTRGGEWRPTGNALMKPGSQDRIKIGRNKYQLMS